MKSLILLLRPCNLKADRMWEYEDMVEDYRGLDADLCRTALDWALNEDNCLFDLPEILPDYFDSKDYPVMEPEGIGQLVNLALQCGRGVPGGEPGSGLVGEK